jgi:hypothetical protein
MSEDESQKQSINSALSELESLLSQAQETASQLSIRHKSIEKLLENTEARHAVFQSLVGELEVLKKDAEEKKNAVISDIQVIAEQKGKFEDLQNQSHTTRDELVKRQSALAAKISEIESAYERINQQQGVLFDDSTDNNGAVIRSIVNQFHDSNTSIKTLLSEVKRESQASIDEVKKSLEESKTNIALLYATTEGKLQVLIDESQVEFSELKQSLEQDIRSLLPEAGAAGLASTFFQAKSKYAITASEPKSKNAAVREFLRIGHFILSALTPTFFYAMFIVPLVGVFYIFYDLLHFIEGQPPGADIHIDPSILVYRILLSLPLAWVSFFGWSSIRLYRRLYEEYNYKQRVMQLYHSFKEEIGTEDNDNYKALMGIMLAAVADKPSLAMNQYDSSGKGLLSEIGMSEFIKRALGKLSG